ncbi:MAG: hypothetical protein GEU75_07170 [Dehalococcoidia bacterium]|nr:hypothetical protein [Dehalococcoidia bacterium]
MELAKRIQLPFLPAKPKIPTSPLSQRHEPPARIGVTISLFEVVIESPNRQEYGRYVANRVKMNFPAPGICCLFNEGPSTDSPTAWTEWHIQILDAELLVEQQPPVITES